MDITAITDITSIMDIIDTKDIMEIKDIMDIKNIIDYTDINDLSHQCNQHGYCRYKTVIRVTRPPRAQITDTTVSRP
jgi:hypothetical protein